MALKLPLIPLCTPSNLSSHSTINMYITNSSALMNFIKNNKILLPHPDTKHPPLAPSLNWATILPKNLQEDKSALTVEDHMAHIQIWI